MSWSILYTPAALEDKLQLATLGFNQVFEQVLQQLQAQPQTGTALVADLAGAYHKTIIGQHAIIYQPITEQKIIKILAIV